VIGAGAAGVAAAHKLHDAGVDIVVLEARERLGGRIFTRRDAATSVPIELGAEFIHGSAPELRRVLRDASIPSIDVGGQRWMTAGKGLRPIDDFWERLDRVMRRLPRSTRDRSFHDFLAEQPGGRRLARERTLARQFVEDFHAADARLISARALAGSGSPRGDVREQRIGRIVGGYDRLIEWLAGPVAPSIQTSTIVTTVRWQRKRVLIETRYADGRARAPVEAAAAIVAVPLGVLQAPADAVGAIAFLPELTQKQAALERLAAGFVLRVTLRLSEPFWASDWFAKRMRTKSLDTLSFLHTADEEFPVWWTAYPMQTPVIVGWRGGPGAHRLAQLPPEDIEDCAMASLARQSGIPLSRIRRMVEGVWMHNWEHDPFARGAYTYQKVGGADAPGLLARPIQSTLFFAGEATNREGGTGTVDGAIATGHRAARQVLRALRLRT
jgi:monoamine oxidase